MIEEIESAHYAIAKTGEVLYSQIEGKCTRYRCLLHQEKSCHSTDLGRLEDQPPKPSLVNRHDSTLYLEAELGAPNQCT